MKKRYRYWAPTKLRAQGDIIPSRESAALWLWERPSLLGWERPIQWLFLRVFESRWHLWGIDSKGCLIIVEATIDRREGPKDPFGGLVAYAETRCNNDEWTAEELRLRWREYLRSKQAVTDAASFVPPLKKPAYKRAVEQSLTQREITGNPPPTFVALVGSRRAEFDYSDEGTKNRLFLENLMGAARVRLRAISGKLGFESFLIESWSPRPRRGHHWERLYEMC